MTRKRLLQMCVACFILCPSGSGCSSQPTEWNKASKAEIDTKNKDGAKLKEIHLAQTNSGRFEGTGKGEDGFAYKIKALFGCVEWPKEIHLTETESGKYKGTFTGEDGHARKITAIYTFTGHGDFQDKEDEVFKNKYLLYWASEDPQGGQKGSKGLGKIWVIYE